ncbi:hypothetical protein [Actinomycetospora aeridis]|uniref:Uncharacterized protein n=1 Tax=Actinomycetospora aeridis TaxID=3129231 RepID=A0ABU8N8X6_9PSEU
MDVVATGPWLRVADSGLDELTSELPGWDYDSVLRLRRPVRVDGLRARRSCGLEPDADLAITVVWSATSSALRGRAWTASVPPEKDVDLEIDFELAGGELGGRLDLETLLTLRSAGSNAGPAAPRRLGSVLWRDVHPILLQGEAVLFPLSVVDFEHLPYPTGAAWHLELGHDLEAQALGSILLLANSRRHNVTSALASAAEPSDADRRVLSALRTDVIRSLVERALVDEEFSVEDDHEVGSIGALLAAVLRHAFPDRSLEALRRDRAHDPILFTTRVQAATELLAES